MQSRTLFMVLAAATVLVACGGGGGGGSIGAALPGTGGGATAPGGTVPASAFASVDAFVAFLRQLGTDDTSEPLALPGTTAAPTTDSAEPT